jgi:cytochrome c-type biogenesis protein CcmH
MKFLVFIFILASTPSWAFEPAEVLQDERLEQRARDISKELRCLVCQNQSIDDSDADLAKDLRIIVREKLSQGYTERQIFDFLVERYGTFILLKPRFGFNTFILWATPIFLLLAGITALALSFRQANETSSEEALTKEQQARIDEITKM